MGAVAYRSRCGLLLFLVLLFSLRPTQLPLTSFSGTFSYAHTLLATMSPPMYIHCRYGGNVKARVQKWGNSLAVRIPKAFASDLGLEQEATVELELEDGHLVLKPATVLRYELDSLLSQVSEDNRHGEADYGGPVGGEQW